MIAILICSVIAIITIGFIMFGYLMGHSEGKTQGGIAVLIAVVFLGFGIFCSSVPATIEYKTIEAVEIARTKTALIVLPENYKEYIYTKDHDAYAASDNEIKVCKTIFLNAYGFEIRSSVKVIIVKAPQLENK